MKYLNSAIIIILLLVSNDCFSQQEEQTKEVEIINADLLRFYEIDGNKFTRLVGNVQLKQDAMYMLCDSADVDKKSNTVEAWGNVQIQNDSITAFSKYLKYESNSKLATLKRDVVLTDSKMKLFTDELIYNSQEKVAYYFTGGKIFRETSVIKSVRGYYYTKTDDLFFNKNVSIKDPAYTLTSDTLQYNVKTDITTFYGNTIIDNKNSKIYCDNGTFDTKMNLANFGKNTRIVDDHQTLFADSLEYDRKNNIGRAFDNFHWKDTTMDIELFGKKAIYKEERESIKVYEQALMMNKMEADTLYLTADTLWSINQSKTDSTKTFSAYKHAKLFTKNMQAKCDSLFYSFKDSTFRLHYDPIVWNDSVQMSGDSIYLLLKNKKADKLIIRNNAFIISPSGKGLFDQIKGKTIYGFFVENSLQHVTVETNAESIYYGKDDNGKFIGSNKAACVKMHIYFKDKKIGKVTFLQKPEAVFIPMKLMTKDDFHLVGYRWQMEKKPKFPEDFPPFIK